MRAIVFERPGDASVLHVAEVPSPAPGPDDLLIRVSATALNRADLLQRRGLYPPPPGASEILGLECSGSVAAVGARVRGWSEGDRVMALLPGGGYAEEAVVHAGSAMRIPDALTDEEAAALPEVFLTSFLNIFMLARAGPGELALVHGGGSGVGTASISLCREAGVRIAITAGTDEKCQRCLELGSEQAINYQKEDFASRARDWSGGRGVDVILDCIGASYLRKNLASLAMNGRLVIIGGMGGRRSEIDLDVLLSKRATIIGSTLRSRPVEQKEGIVLAFLDRFGAALETRRVGPVIDRVFPLSDAAAAHRLMESSGHFGKIVLSVRP